MAYTKKALLTICLLSILGAIMYYLMPVTTLGLLVLAVGVVAGSGRVSSGLKVSLAKTAPYTKHEVALTAIALVGICAWWAATLGLQVDEAVRTPWATAPAFAIVALGVAALAAIVLIVRGRTLGTWLLTAITFSAVTLAVFLYPYGYGFDPFLHRATVAHIAEFGTITPKPLYYIGQYALELFAIKLFILPLYWVDALLAPALLCLALLAIFTSPKYPSPLAFLFLPLGAFVSTTPQALAYVFTLAAVYFSWDRLTQHGNRLPMYLCAIAALFTHPLAGIPAAMLVVMTEASAITSTMLRRTVLALGTALAAITLPLVFAVQAKLAGLDVGLSLNNLFDLSRLPLTGFFSNHFNTWFDGLYLVIENLFWIVVVLAVAGMLVAKRSYPRWYIPGLLALALCMNFAILSLAFDFTYLISYERTDFALRLLTLAQLALLPYVGIALSHGFTSLAAKPPALKLAASTVLAACFAASVYGAYPRHDAYARSAGFNVTQADINAVHTINDREGDSDYIVLSNQAVAAAAVHEFGFHRYYHDDIFYYPIPTGGPMYEIYLDMVDNAPTRAKAEAAMNLAGVNVAYFVVNDYWWKSDQIIENAKREADEWFSLGNGQITLFRFSKEL